MASAEKLFKFIAWFILMGSALTYEEVLTDSDLTPKFPPLRPNNNDQTILDSLQKDRYFDAYLYRKKHQETNRSRSRPFLNITDNGIKKLYLVNESQKLLKDGKFKLNKRLSDTSDESSQKNKYLQNNKKSLKSHFKVEPNRRKHRKFKTAKSKKAKRMSKRKSQRRLRSKKLKCSTYSEISCPFKCISSNKICDGTKDCLDGSDESNCMELQIGLYDGKRKGEGRVEITMNGFKGTVCSKGWTDNDASVYCKMLGHRNGGKAALARKEDFGSGSGLVWSTKFNCKGGENDLFECPLYKRKIYCSHWHDAAVICNPIMDSLDADHQTTLPSSPNLNNPQCGKKIIKHPFLKVMGGQTATYGSQPWQARLVLKNSFRHLCGASIIDDTWIITAGHCLKNLGSEDIAIIVGDHVLTLRDRHEQLFGVEKVFVHPMFNKHKSGNINDDHFFDSIFNDPFFSFSFKGKSYWQSRRTASSFKNDIALLKLQRYKNNKRSLEKIIFNDYVQPICLPDEKTPYQTNLKCDISGWGYSGKNKKGVLRLQVAKLALISQSECENAYSPVFFQKLPPQMVCAGSIMGNTDTCQGDSGGPLVCKTNDTYTLMGVTSWGFECGESSAPGIYTKVGALRKWIDEIKEKN